ncbi:hypothetical protein BGW36DRAFT_63991 [Talaromyces proteolyticus]|uniref:Uncharacterized protein n=1 Tax=Talaromyces proteolyticus TaxID=1131652 RepID=A0AAD4KE52_9EURO|nr:uncharacterized protein BGW36DRAFT_63991 [Talaromyces proteolyticus]KAH8689823.1 hypothetical protein BGW36DRAFT_63991 [Talaromyces proteolyticus]
MVRFNVHFFESSSDVVDVVWDIILFYYIMSIALHYSIFIFFCSLPLTGAISILRYPVFELTQHQWEMRIMFLSTLISFWCARYSMKTYQVPQKVNFRLVIGLLATVILVAGELALWTAFYFEWSSWRDWYNQSDNITWVIIVTTTALIALMPCLVMMVEDAEINLFDEPPDSIEEENKNSMIHRAAGAEVETLS